jgi:hypothetical protein
MTATQKISRKDIRKDNSKEIAYPHEKSSLGISQINTGRRKSRWSNMWQKRENNDTRPGYLSRHTEMHKTTLLAVIEMAKRVLCLLISLDLFENK